MALKRQELLHANSNKAVAEPALEPKWLRSTRDRA
eukprot:CAMPEP_0114665188 /NCGR_PEP_ID=MMETSP0191-20121206/30264_1 /TAXON_ID=126664 /ORGANISM="Sorites sp." /LENGTH=34 /DNA_ID= /DNA_START= /DNA_END= /DNA_ORIENTATION=